uniref:FxsC protein n=1 Tax=Frankia sp. CiP3 TaxID=2880971 RepID=UPI001EF483C7
TVAQAIQYREFNDEYMNLGLMKIVKNKKDPSLALNYDKMLGAIVLEIKDAAEKHVLTPMARPPELAATKNAFAKKTELPGGAVRPGDAGNATGADQVHFIVASGTAPELARDSDPYTYYGARPTDWSPFRPHDTEPLIHIAAAIAIDQKMTPYPEKLDRQLVERLDAADRDNELVVLLVDPRATGLPDRAEALRAYDNRFDPNSAVMITWNNTDVSAVNCLSGLKATFPKKNRKPDQSFYRAIHTPDEFRRTLIEVLVYLQKLLIGEADSSRTADSGDHIRQPQLTGPTVGA